MKPVVGMLICVVAGTMIGLAPAQAEISTSDALSAAARTDATSGEDYVAVTIPEDLIAAKAKLEYVGLEFKTTWPAGTEVELWLATASTALPWVDEANEAERLVWVIDERTGNRVRFDLTEIIQTLGETKGATQVLLRLAPDGTPEGTEMRLPTDVKVISHRTP